MAQRQAHRHPVQVMTELWPEGKAPQYGPNTTTLKPGVWFARHGELAQWALDNDQTRRSTYPLRFGMSAAGKT